MKNKLDKEVLEKRIFEKIPDIRGSYFRDQTAIIHSMPYRRLKHKTQVFFSPKNDHICTRIEHVQHVATIAATICKGLNLHGWELDGEMAYAIGLGHDLGHAPFGHAGETALSDCLETKFMHELNSYRVVNILANDGKGLNLTYAVNDGIICHNGEQFEKSIEPSIAQNNLESIKDRKFFPSTWEGCIVRFSDKIAYLGRDIEDAITSGIITQEDIPEEVQSILGENNGEIINTLVLDLIDASEKEHKICFSDEIYSKMVQLKEFNYKEIYGHKSLTEYKKYTGNMIKVIFEHLKKLFCKYGFDFKGYQTENIPISKSFGIYLKKMEHVYSHDNNVPNQILSDYISGMTDSFTIDSMKQICIPKEL
jgi:dGTPase